jgi:hypothetical protein
MTEIIQPFVRVYRGMVVAEPPRLRKTFFDQTRVKIRERRVKIVRKRECKKRI